MRCPDSDPSPAEPAPCGAAGTRGPATAADTPAEPLRRAIQGGQIVPWTWDLMGGTLTLLENHQLVCGSPRLNSTFDEREILAFVAEQDHDVLRKAVLHTRSTGDDFQCRFRGRPDRESNSMRWYASRGTPDSTAAGPPQRLSGVAWEITEHIACETVLRSQLAHAARLGNIGELAAGLAHELNQPLAALRLFASAARELGNGDQLQECLRHIDEQSHRAGEIIRRMRSFASPAPFRRGPADLNHVVREVLWILDNELRHAQVAAELQLAERLPPLSADAIQLQQILVNLVRNAIDAMQQPGGRRQMVVRTTNLTSAIELSVTDSGAGIVPSIAPHLFEPFQTTKAAGLGLGLSICRTLVESHGGSIRAEANPGGGTTFLVVLPVAQDQAGT